MLVLGVHCAAGPRLAEQHRSKAQALCVTQGRADTWVKQVRALHLHSNHVEIWVASDTGPVERTKTHRTNSMNPLLIT